MTSPQYVLTTFGGAGGQHACLVADALGMTRVFAIRSPACCPPTAWVSPIRRPCANGRWKSRSTQTLLPTLEARSSTPLADDATGALLAQERRRGAHHDRAACASALSTAPIRRWSSSSGSARRRCAPRSKRHIASAMRS